MSSESRPLALTDSQLDQIIRCSQPLEPQMRAVFIERVAAELRNKVVGDGEVWRACVSVLKESGMFHPPLSEEHGPNRNVSKYARL
jgi:hypothetical protein